MAETLSYATDRILLEQEPGAVRVTLPAPGMWREAVGLSVGLAMAVTGHVAGVWMVLTGVRTRAGFGSMMLVIVGSATAWSFVVAVVSLARQLVRLPEKARLPTVIEATPAGLLVSTGGHGVPEQIHYPARRMVGFGVFDGPLSVTLRRTARIVIRLRSTEPLVGHDTIVLEFASPYPWLCDRLGEPMLQVFGLEPSAAAVAEKFRWEMIDRRL